MSKIQDLPPQYNPKEVENRIYRLWEESGFFNPDKLPKRKTQNIRHKTYCITVPPPNITGSLHMGHALNATIQDILIRKRRMEGYRTLWLPGTDHAGIATQNVVEKELKKQGISRYELGREKFLEKVWEWKEKFGHIILDQFKNLGASMDWSRTRFTMDAKYQKAVERAFLHYYEKGWIYRAERVVNWCPRCATSLSELEIEYQDVQAVLYYIKYPVIWQVNEDSSNNQRRGSSRQDLRTDRPEPAYIVVATTRPETMLGDAAIAVNPADERYKNFIGKKATLPIKNREIPIIVDVAVEKEFGTGAVKVTPAHDLLDAEIGERHRLPTYKIIGPEGKMTKEAGQICEGLKVSECRERVVKELRRLGLLEKEEPYKHHVARCYRCDTNVEPLPSLQWFLKMAELAKIARREVRSGKVRFHPKRWEKVYFEWLKNVKDWCISRQIWWGHRMPVYFCRNKPEGISHFPFSISRQTQNSKLEIQNFVTSTVKPTKCPLCRKCTMKQADDVLDTWFSSALWPFATLGWPEACEQNQKSKTRNQKLCRPLRGSDLERFYPTSIISTARDIINLWVARMVFSGREFIGREPFRDVIIHATILTKEGKRMSKSLGTGVDPMDLIERYGADATRFGLIWQAMGGQDIHWSEEHVVAGKKFCNKMWNAARFVLLQAPNCKLPLPKRFKIPKLKTEADRMILEQLERTKKEVNRRLENYEFGQALHLFYDFFWHTFCDIYLEKAKSQMLDTTRQRPTWQILIYVLSESLKLLHPFMPFITEEIWGRLPIKHKRLLLIERWPN